MKKQTFLLSTTFLFAFSFSSYSQETQYIEGLRENNPNIHLLQNCKIVSPNQTIKNGSILIENGVIKKIGKSIKTDVPAKIWDYKGKTVYPGLIESYLPISDLSENKYEKDNKIGHWNQFVTPERNIYQEIDFDKEKLEKLNKLGFTSALIVPERGVFRGTSSFVSLNDNKKTILKKEVFHHIAFDKSSYDEDFYPSSLMGSIALIRQTLYDSKWYKKAKKTSNLSGVRKIENNISLEALQDLNSDFPVMFEVGNNLNYLRAKKLAKDFDLNSYFRGNGYEYRSLDKLDSKKTLVLPINFPNSLGIEDYDDALDVTLKSLQHWETAPANPYFLNKNKQKFTLTSNGLKDKKDFLGKIKNSIDNGLSEEEALKALTINPAKLFGVDNKLGSIEVGKLAHFVVTDGNLFSKKTKINDVWIDGIRKEVNKDKNNLSGNWDAIFDISNKRFIVDFSAEDEKYSGKLTEKLDEENKDELIKVGLLEDRISFVLRGETLGSKGFIHFNGKVSDEKIIGKGYLDDGSSFVWNAFKVKKIEKDKTKKDKEKEIKKLNKLSLLDQGTNLNDYSKKTILVKNATIWTSGKKGNLDNADLLVRNGKIIQVGKSLNSNADLVIDATGKHVTPGLIDAHSHTGINGGVNEYTHSITSEVRIGDVVNSYDLAFYRELAGGLTVANLLHGSANPIGGQNQLVKLLWGLSPEEIKFKEALPGIKFALGENVKQSNWGDDYTTRYPQTRMGTEQFIRDRFQAAKEYQSAMDKYNKLSKSEQNKVIPPRKNLRLDALAEIIAKERLVHIHSYRQDEILAMIRIAEDYGFTIGTLQHVLEGYKIANIIAKHGAGASTFSDWWAYKFEVYDAIPYNGALMHNQDVVVSFNSDDRELARRLNTEAAKAIKYGGLKPEEALKFVTLNPAKQFKVDKYIGSLEKGKSADFVIWDRNPLSSYAVCEQTWINGNKYFDKAKDLELREKINLERNRIIQKYLSSKNKPIDKKDKKEK